MATSRTARNRGPRLTRTGAWLHWIGMIAMVVSMFAPMYLADAAAEPMTASRAMLLAQRIPLDRDTADFDRVVAVGDFQNQLGCGDWDVNCAQSGLGDNNGFWTAALSVQPGNYSYELVGIDTTGTQYLLDSGQVALGGDQTGLYFEFDSSDRSTEASGVTNAVTVSGPFGTVALAQDGADYVAESINVTADGPVDMQVQLPEGTVPVNAQLNEGANRVRFDAAGNVVQVEDLGFAELTIARTNANGDPLSGSCFVLDGSSQTRGCDSDDGSNDGNITLSFPGGFQPGSYTLRETRPAEGEESAPDQQIDVQEGRATVQVQTGEATPETGDVVVLRQDENGTPVGGACFEVIDASGQSVSSACDEDGDVPDDGRIGLFEIPAGDYTVRETRTPDGYEPAGDASVTVQPQMSVDVPVQGPAIVVEQPTEVPTEEPIESPTDVPTEETAQPGNLVINRNDGQGSMVGGACFEIIDANGQNAGTQCDEDGWAADDGVTGIYDVPAGTYTLRETRTPDGFEKVADTQVTIQPGIDNNVDVTGAPTAVEQPTAVPTEEPIESPTEVPTEEPIESPTDVPTEETAQPGNLVINRNDGQGSMVGGACFEVIDANGQNAGTQCDEDGWAADDGVTGIYDVPAGTYTLRETRTPDGFEKVADTQVTIQPGIDNNVDVTGAPTSVEQPTAEPTDVPAEEPTSEPVSEGAALEVTYPASEGEPQVCIELETTGAIGGMEIPYACDGGANDTSDASGTVRMEGLTPGEFNVVVYEGPQDLVQADVESVSLTEGEVTTLELEAPAPITTSYVVTTTDGTNPVPGACYSLNDGTPVCDDDQDGSVTFSDVTPGDYTLSMSTAPDGYTAAEDQQVTVAADSSSTTSVTVTRATTSYVVSTTDGTNPVPGACYSLNDGTPVCDDDQDGSVTFNEVTPGEYTLSMSTAPDGYTAAADQPVTITADGSSTTSVTVTRATTSYVVTTTDGTNPVPGACYSLNDGTPVCDDDQDGSVTFNEVTPGEYTLSMTTAPDGYTAAEDQQVTVAADGSSTTSVTVTRATTSYVVTTTDGTNPVPGACYTLNDGTPVCDDDQDGSVTFNDVTPGEYTLSMTTAPDGYTAAEAQQVTVATDGANETTVTLARETIALNVTTVDAATGESLEAACYTLDGGAAVCDDDNDGVVEFTGVEPVEHTLVMTQAPANYNIPAETVVDAGVTSVTVQVTAQTGSANVTIVDEADAALGNACVRVDSGTEYCDDDGDGQITIDGLALGERSIAVSQVPDGYDVPAEASVVTIVANETQQARFVVQRTPPATGGMDVTTLFDDESAATGVCITITLANTDTQLNACDGGENDTNPAEGVIGFQDLEVGTYEVAITPGTTIPGATDDAISPISVTVTAGETSGGLMYIPLAPTTGTLIVAISDNGAAVGESCIMVDGTTYCDNDDSDQDGRIGFIQVGNLEPGSYLITMSTVPGGYESPAEQTAEIIAGESSQVNFTLTRVAPTGVLVVSTTNQDDEPLPGACYALMQNGVRIGTVCDANDATPNDGSVRFENLAAGMYDVVQTRAPGSQYSTAPTQRVEITSGETTELNIVMDLRPGRLTVVTVDRDEPTFRLENACYTLVGDVTYGPFCDADDGRVDGRVVFTNVPAGQYELRQTVATAGYDAATNRNVTISAGGSLQITVQNAKTPPPAESGILVVRPMDPNGNNVAGGCYQVFDGDTAVSQRVCDNADAAPGSISFQNLPVGEFTLREQLAPSPDWQIAANITVTIRNGETTTVEVPHVFRTGTVVVQAVNSVGLPLQNACFTLSSAGDTELCTASNGQVTVADLQPGTRQLTQSKAPFGYKLNTAPRDVVVKPGQTTVVRVVFENEPPPNTGTVQIQKFVCPAGDLGERTVFMGGARGNAELKQTAGCVPAPATFTLVAENGSTTSNAEFSTNAEGRAQRTAEQGIYLLTETEPDMPGNSAARIRVGVGQMTTVIVLNYVAPPAPEMVSINVEGYTCPPGFTGTTFADFQASCMAPNQLTNQITVRAEGAARYKHVTGDLGQVGKTQFNELPAGTYTIWAERPYTTPLSYLFCGPDPNAPTLRSVNGSVVTTAESGSAITCRVFMVPPLYDAEHGAIQVQKYNCPINERRRGYDYRKECERATEPVPFEIQLVAKDSTGEPTRISTNSDGIAQFPMLRPGTYKLTEVGGEWCFAQSNSVDAQGNVVVNKNNLSEVWIYNCVGTSSPPNTGSGDAAELLNPEEGIGPMQVLPNLVWPVVLLAAWLVWRERRTA